MRAHAWPERLRAKIHEPPGSSRPNEKDIMRNTDQNRPGAIVLGGNFVGLGVVRSLGARGIPAWIVDTDRSKCIAQFSRYTTRFVETKNAIADVLLEEGREHQLNGWILIPVADDYVEILSANHQA